MSKHHHARIMIEGGCTIEDVCVTLGMTFNEALHAVAPSLKANPEELKRVRRLVTGMRLPFPDAMRTRPAIHIIHSHERSVDVRKVKAA